MIETPSEAEAAAQLAGGDRPRRARPACREGRVDRGADHHQVARRPRRSAGRAPRRPAAGCASRGRSAGRRSRCSRVRRRGPGSAWRWRRPRRAASPPRTAPPSRFTPRAVEPKPRSVSAITPPGRPTSSTGARSTLTPTSRRLRGGAPALPAAEGGPRAPISSAEAVGAPLSRFTSPPSWSTMTSSGSRRCRRPAESPAAGRSAAGPRRGWGGCRRTGSRRRPRPSRIIRAPGRGSRCRRSRPRSAARRAGRAVSRSAAVCRGAERRRRAPPRRRRRPAASAREQRAGEPAGACVSVRRPRRRS